MQTKYKISKLFYIFAVLTILSICTNFVSFVSPFWIQSIPDAHSQFKRIGLWTACFDGYMRPGQYYKAYFGCYYIYFIEYDLIRSWLNPAWLYAIQVVYSCGIILHFLVTFVVICQFNNAVKRDDFVAIKFCVLGNFLICFSLVAVLVAFAVARYDSTWMPNPQLNVLSWSYATGALSLSLCFAAFVVGFVRFLYMDASLVKVSENEPLLNPVDTNRNSPHPPSMYEQLRQPEVDSYNRITTEAPEHEEIDTGLLSDDPDGTSESPNFDPRYPPTSVFTQNVVPERRYH